MPAIKEKKKKLSPEEKEQKKLEKRQQRLRDHFEREHNFTQVSKKRDENFYQHLCENFERLHLLEEINVSQQLVKHKHDKREHLLDVFKSHRDHAADQHMRLFACHTKLIDNLIALQNIFQNSLHEIYKANRMELVRDFYAEKLHRDKLLHERKIYYENYAHAYRTLMKSREKQNEEKHINQLYELDADYFIANENLYEKKIKLNQSICDEVSSIYAKFTSIWNKKRLQHYERLDKSNESETQIIMKQEREINKRKLQIKELKEKIEEIKSEHENDIEKSKGFYNFLFDYYNELIENIKTMEKETDLKLKMILIKAEKFKKKLLKLVEIGNNIERIIKLCKKHENLDDLMLKYRNDNENFEVIENVNLSALKISKDYEKNLNMPIKMVETPSKNLLHCKEIISQSSLNFENFNKVEIEETKHINDSLQQKIEENKNSVQNCFLFNLYQSTFIQNNEDDDEKLKLKPSVKFNSISPSETLNANLELVETSENKIQEQNSTLKNDNSLNLIKNFSESSFNHHFGSHTNDFFLKIAHVETDCIQLQNYKLNLEKQNQEIRELIKRKKREFEVDENLKILNLNKAKSVGKIGQISHQITQIRDKIKKK
ncbi:hypothetical protein PVAND_007785 [Polypedilum vanderplanki]|uniref:Uncharacterized protein n=1 Tax=Polypedilum vanderplanki TaxID=319348 RepID=A0A9J6C8G9_POLVA|nr:hypothetical protein PVAND_007785 [Polypedilum vanderplanki]